MPTDIPEFIKSGDRARLLPVVADSSKEVRASSIFLSVLSAVPAFRSVMLATLGQKTGPRTEIKCYTEVVFANEPPDLKCRPDGLIIIESGRGNRWSCLIEVKTGGAVLSDEQVEKYAQLAKMNDIAAIVTLSNQFVASPSHTPLKLPRSATRGVELFHWSWMFILTQSQLALHELEFAESTQRYLLSEFIRNLDHPSSGISRFDQMNPEWKDLVAKVQSGAVLNKSDPAVELSVAAWHQELRDLSLLLSRQLRRLVTISLPKSHRESGELWLRDDCDLLVRKHRLQGVLIVPDAAAPLEITADLLRRSLNVSMTLEAPKDKQRASARINWILRQLSKSVSPGIQIRALWPGRAPATQVSLESLRQSPELLEAENKSLTPQTFEVLLVADLAGKFAGRKTFIEQIEEFVPLFYKDVGEHLIAYVPPPPKIVPQENSPACETPSVPIEATMAPDTSGPKVGLTTSTSAQQNTPSPAEPLASPVEGPPTTAAN